MHRSDVFYREAPVSDAAAASTALVPVRFNLIGSENHPSRAVYEAMADPLIEKYAEGYPGARYYHGCKPADIVEDECRKRMCALFGAEHANVQPHGGSGANLAVYTSFLTVGDPIVAMDLNSGGHLSHGHPVNLSGKLYKFERYKIADKSSTLDYNAVADAVKSHKPKLLVGGASAYTWEFDWAKMREIADSVGARLMADVAHTAGLIAGGEHKSPFPHADYATFTTQKTFRGPRGGVILCRNDYAKAVDRALFPGLQGGPHMHTIKAKLVAAREAGTPEFKQYAKEVRANTQTMIGVFREAGFEIVYGGSDMHQFLVDVTTATGLTGNRVADRLEERGIVVNANYLIGDGKNPTGIRVGTAHMTSMGLGRHAASVAAEIIDVLKTTKPD
jgi:glycine hydroxymethyltransferase